MKKAANKSRYLIFGAIVGAAILILIVVGYFGSYLGASLRGAGSDTGRLFRPLVRHQISQLHCYDDGSFFCERDHNAGGGLNKEFTLGFLRHTSKFQNRAKTVPVYSCASPSRNLFTIAVGRNEFREICRQGNYRSSYKLGYIFADPVAEQATPLYRCRTIDADSLDTLLTDDANECKSLVGYSPAELLGYMVGAAGPAQNRLNSLCAVVNNECGSSTQGICGTKKELCRLASPSQ